MGENAEADHHSSHSSNPAAGTSTTRNTVRETDIARLVRLGRTEEAFARAEVVAAGAKKLSTLLPDAHVPNMLQREPQIVDLNFVRASQSILELQTVLCSSDHCSDVTAVLERCPRWGSCFAREGKLIAFERPM